MRQLFVYLFAFLTFAAGNAQTVYDPAQNADAVVESGNARFTVLTPEMIRIQFSKYKQFEDRATFGIVNRRQTVYEL